MREILKHIKVWFMLIRVNFMSQMEYRANFVRGVERIGGFGGKSDVLAMNEVYAGRPDYYRVTQERLGSATAAQVSA